MVRAAASLKSLLPPLGRDVVTTCAGSVFAALHAAFLVFFFDAEYEGRKCQSVQTLSTTLDSGNRTKWQVATSTNNLRRKRCVAVTPQSRSLLQER